MEKYALLFRDFFNKLMNRSLKNRGIVLLIDLLICAVGFLCSFWVQINTFIISVTDFDWLFHLFIFLAACFLSFFTLKSYRGLIRHSSFREIWRIFISLFISGCVLYFDLLLSDIPKGPSFLFVSCTFLFSYFIILFFRLTTVYLFVRMKMITIGKRKKALMYGIGSHSLSLANWVNRSSHSQYFIQGYITRDKHAKKTRIQDLPVFILDEDKFDWLFSKYEITTIIFPGYQSVKNEQVFIGTCIDMGLSVLVSPPLEGVEASRMTKIQMKPIQLENVLERDEIHINMERIAEQSKGKTILITGAAGSIGSEIVKLLAQTNPHLLILFDMAETPLHNLQLEMQKNYPDTRILPVIGDVRNKNRLDKLFSAYKPQMVYHAAAYKHVSLMEDNPCEAVLVNTLGAKLVCDTALEHDVECFVLVSTDKAVNPANIMGISKQMAERYVQAKAQENKKGSSRFMIVRFGNALGSNGSAIPRFRKQIEDGGPVTVSHPDMYRYYVTLSEAGRMVLETASLGENGHIYLFDMGEPVRISSLASKMIELAGYVPNKDIKIVYTGLRPGEKMNEQPYSDSKFVSKTEHEHILVDGLPATDLKNITKLIEELVDLSEKVDVPATVSLLKSSLSHLQLQTNGVTNQ